MRHTLPLLPLLPMFLVAAACDQDFTVITPTSPTVGADGSVVVAAPDSGTTLTDSGAPGSIDSGTVVGPDICATPSVSQQLTARPYPAECDGLACMVSYDGAGGYRKLFAEPDDIVPSGYFLRPLGATQTRAYFEAYDGSSTASLIVSASLSGATLDQRVEANIALNPGDHIVVNGNDKRLFVLVVASTSSARLYRTIPDSDVTRPGVFAEALGGNLVGLGKSNTRLSLLKSGRLDGEDDVYVASETAGGALFFGIDHVRGIRTDYVSPDPAGLSGFAISGADSNQGYLSGFRTEPSATERLEIYRIPTPGAPTPVNLILEHRLGEAVSVHSRWSAHNKVYSAWTPTGVLVNTGSEILTAVGGGASRVYSSANTAPNAYPALSDVWYDYNPTGSASPVYALEACPNGNPEVPRYELRLIDTYSGTGSWISSLPGTGANWAKMKAWYGGGRSSTEMPTPSGSVILRRTL